VEVGTPTEGGAMALDGYEQASRLSYLLWNSMPDDDLFAAAAAGELATPEGLRGQAERMLYDGRARDAIGSFHLQWLGLREIGELDKDSATFPQFDADLRDAMTREVVRTTDYIVRFTEGTLSTLLTAPMSFPEGGLFALYGIAPPAEADLTVPVQLDPRERAGVLTLPGVLAVHAHADQGSPVRRGAFVRTKLLCQELPSPPPDVDDTPPAPSDDATTRDRFDRHRTDPQCAVCHELIDPIGYGFEEFDGLGRYRTTENGLPIDRSGEIIGANDLDGPFDGVVDLAYRLASSDRVQDCMSEQWFEFTFGRQASEGDECSMEQINLKFAMTGYELRELLFAIVESDSFRHRGVFGG
jgi:hypothetical protein